MKARTELFRPGLWRSLRCGHAHAAAATPDFLDTAPFRVVVELAVMAPIGACWELLADQESWLQWFDGMSAVSPSPRIWTEPGQTRIVTVNRLKVHEEAISVDPEREYAFTIKKWPLPIAVRAAEGVRLEDRTNRGTARTHLTYIGAFESNTIGRRVERVLESQLRPAWGDALKKMGVLAAASAAT